MSIPSFLTTLVLVLPLLFRPDGDADSQSTANQNLGSTPNLVLATVKNPYMALTAEDHQPHGDVENPKQWHAFALVGTDKFFASHLTNLGMEVHKYHLIAELSLPDSERSRLVEEIKRYPDDSFFVANLFPDDSIGSGDDPMNLPELASGRRSSFKGNVWRGIPNKPVYDDWPWRGVQPILSNVPITIKRVVYFAPFAESMNHSDRLSYLLFGSGAEAHLVHLQTKHGSEPDYDHVVTLTKAPDWLEPDLLEAGVVVDLPYKPRFGDDQDRAQGVRCATPLKDGSETDVRYRGASPVRRITISKNKWFCTRIANMPDENRRAPCEEFNQQACGSEP
jgi:hypothetical protein